MTVWKRAHTANGINMQRVTPAARLCVVSATQELSHAVDESVSFLFALLNVHCTHRGALMGPLHRLSVYVTTVCQDPFMQQAATRFLWNSACRPCSFNGVKVKGYGTKIRNSVCLLELIPSASLCHNRNSCLIAICSWRTNQIVFHAEFTEVIRYLQMFLQQYL